MKTENVVALPGKDIQGIEVGTVNGGSDERYIIHGASGMFVATVAFSCLVKPLAGDKVMFTRAPDGSCYILSILERPTGNDAVVAFPGDVVVQAASGRVSISGSDGIDMTTAAAMNMLATDINASAASGQFTIAEMQATGSHFTGNIGKVRMFSEAIEVVAQRALYRLKQSVRWVEQVEHVTAGQLIQSVKTLFSVRSKQSSITAEKDMKVDGERVHIG